MALRSSACLVGWGDCQPGGPVLCLGLWQGAALREQADDAPELGCRGAQAGDSMEAVLAREAFWHALGECMGLASFDEQASFESWYQQEVQGMLLASLQVRPLLLACLHAFLGCGLCIAPTGQACLEPPEAGKVVSQDAAAMHAHASRSSSACLHLAW